MVSFAVPRLIIMILCELAIFFKLRFIFSIFFIDNRASCLVNSLK